MSDQNRRHMALFPIGIVTKLTELTARQIRYYEANHLIQPARSASNQRLFSFHDIDRLLTIKSYIEKGMNIAGIKQVMKMGQAASKSEARSDATDQSEQPRQDLTDVELRQFLKQQIIHRQLGETPLIRGELHRFYQN
ncbi:transcriptional regulator [Ammoniphilus oxalaticus]|uniref:Transcriptional regulator n=1 Tax=Ammoniphilus oxalaticus TaxID=66863 RepID=A0A419SQN8_9BACL|nr:MerR family transcriptional regulator [Ammoniphilus oxalaticus]RKD26717.1 transcriptional regulator [Ammoniphilus oxalaticus]